MFKSKTRERRIFTSRKRSRPRFSIFSAIASLVLVLLVLELLTRIFVDLTGNRSQFARANTKSDLTQAYKLQFVGQNGDLDPKSDNTSLKAKPSLAVGYQLLGNQNSEHWSINAEGFRDRDPISLAKPKDEIRVFLLGGSTAFGYGSPSNATTISEYLEQRLQKRLQQQKASPELYKPDVLPFDKVEKQKYLAKPAKIKPGNYRIINASVPGYTSGNELAQLALQILQYKPDLIVVLDGYEDLMLDSEQEAVQAPQIDLDRQNKPTSFVDYVGQFIEPIENKSYLAQIAQDRWLKNGEGDEKQNFILNEPTSNLIKYLPPNKDELQKRVGRYIDRHKQILSLSAAARAPLVVAIQPEITGRNPSQLTDSEGKIATDLGRSYIQQVRDSYPVLIQATQQLAKAFPKNMKAVDLYKLTDKYPSPSFIDPIHLNEAANQKVAEQLYYAIASMPKMQLVPTQAPAPKPVYPRPYLNSR
ncbi:SGNH/GDSL hydrolase family protein [Waterburya agarophytonicola K14]|uniref:SGNH/GDSL hydrolase family protein n=1 Tax=Waterburya agarophytonicola KI4 TaxID=2874699 RepID=A0A964BRS7_9CYAN|nr:SGNH/GDSL hydrolase family protein [Waterburya agarophytonicola]MCC0177636.1 SGNH/GDSL hydrolase family protein [Waterburya agarophytonicola KI4]